MASYLSSIPACGQVVDPQKPAQYVNRYSFIKQLPEHFMWGVVALAVARLIYTVFTKMVRHTIEPLITFLGIWYGAIKVDQVAAMQSVQIENNLLHAHNKVLNSQLQTLNGQIERLESSLKNLDTVPQKLRKEIQTLRELKASLEGTIQTLTTTAQDFDTQVKKQMDLLDKLTNACADEHKKIQELLSQQQGNSPKEARS